MLKLTLATNEEKVYDEFEERNCTYIEVAAFLLRLKQIEKKLIEKEFSTELEVKEEEMKEELTPCPKCNCMTKSIRLGRANYQCGKCKADKSLSDVYFYECIEKEKSNV